MLSHHDFSSAFRLLHECCSATRYKTPTECRYVASQLDICSHCEQSIYAHFVRIRYVAYGNECRLRRCCYLSRVACWATHIERFSAISSRRHIERRISGAYRRRICRVRHTTTRRGSRLQKVSKWSKNGGCNTLKSHFCSQLILFIMKSSRFFSSLGSSLLPLFLMSKNNS